MTLRLGRSQHYLLPRVARRTRSRRAIGSMSYSPVHYAILGDQPPLATVDQHHQAIDQRLDDLNYFYVPISGRLYLQNNEYNSFSALSPYAQNANLDLGNANAAFNPPQTATGFAFPHDMIVERLYGWFRNSGNGAPAWSFHVFKQLKVEDSGAETNTVLWEDANDFRSYGDNLPHFIDQLINQPLAASEMLSLAVRCATNNNTEYVYPLALSFVLKRDFS